MHGHVFIMTKYKSTHFSTLTLAVCTHYNIDTKEASVRLEILTLQDTPLQYKYFALPVQKIIILEENYTPLFVGQLYVY